MTGQCLVHEGDCPNCKLEGMGARIEEDLRGWALQDFVSVREDLNFLRTKHDDLKESHRLLRADFNKLAELVGAERVYVECDECHGIGEDGDLSNMGDCFACGGDGRVPTYALRQTVSKGEN